MKNKEQYFEEVYQKLADKVFRFVLLRVSGREEAIDIAEEVFYKFWQTVSAGEGVANPQAFLFTIARHKVIDWYRKKKPESLDQMIESAEENERPSLQIADEKGYEKMALSSEAVWVVKVLRKLAPQYQEVMSMRFVDDLPLREIADVLGITENAVSLRLHHGLQKLREDLGINIKEDGK